MESRAQTQPKARVLLNLVDSTGASNDRARRVRLMAAFGLERADPAAVEASLALAARTISGRVMTPAQLTRLQRQIPGCFFVKREEGLVTGFAGFAPLSASGVRSVAKFDPTELDLGMVASPTDIPAAIYWLGVAGVTDVARRSVVKAVAALNEMLFWALPLYTRIATKAGERVLLERLGFRRRGKEGLAYRSPRSMPLQGFDLLAHL